MADRSAPPQQPGAITPPPASLNRSTLLLRNCPRCGGSGQLRTGHGGYRTCLDCAARGTINAA